MTRTWCYTMRKQFIDYYLNTVRCHNPMCDECNNNNNYWQHDFTYFYFKYIVIKHTYIIICAQTEHCMDLYSYHKSTLHFFALFRHLNIHYTMVSQEDGWIAMREPNCTFRSRNVSDQCCRFTLFAFLLRGVTGYDLLLKRDGSNTTPVLFPCTFSLENLSQSTRTW